jgi:cytochrome P450
MLIKLPRFRRYLNLKAYDTFEDWNPDKEVARAAELLYGHIENLELYPGLMAECTKPAMPGSGVCPGQTTGRGILDDAVSLVRGDRFLSYDFNSNTLTNWGAALLQESAGGAYGGMMPRLLFNALPGDFTGTSPYVLLPFYTPEAARSILKGNQVTSKYDLSRPVSGNLVLSVQTRDGCKSVLDDRKTFRELSRSLVVQQSNGANGHANGTISSKHSSQETSRLMREAFFEDGYERGMSDFMSGTVRRLIEKNSLGFTKGRRSVDIARDVTNIAPILWLADRFAIPLKTEQQPRGLVSIYETFGSLLVLFMYQSFNVMPLNEWKLREAASTADGLLRPIFEAHIKTQKGYKEAVVDWLAKGSAFEVKPHADRLYHALNDTRRPVSELSTELIDLVVTLAGNLTQQASLLVDLFLNPAYEPYKKRIVELAHLNTPASDLELQGFVYEGMRHAPVVPGLPRMALADVSIVDGARGPIKIKAGQTVLVATSKAALDPKAFPEPEKLDASRVVTDFSLLGHGLEDPRTTKLVVAALAATLREVFRLKNVRRAPGKLGHFTCTQLDFDGVKMNHYLDSSAKESPVPTSLTIQYDA